MKLKNGSDEHEVAVKVVTRSMRGLFKSHPIALFELVEIAKDPKHEPFGVTGEVLERLGLTNKGQMHTTIRNVVLSATAGSGMDLAIGDPAA